MSESQLVAQAIAGDQAAQRALYDAHVDRVYRLAYRVAGDDELARDFTIGTNLTMRQRDNIIWTPFYDAQQFAANGQLVPLYGSSIYDCNNTVSGTAPDGRPYSEPFCVLSNPADPRLGTARARVETNMPGYTQEYQGIEFTATKRLSNKWMMRALVASILAAKIQSLKLKAPELPKAELGKLGMAKAELLKEA